MKRLPYRLFICGKHEVEGFAGSSLTHLLSLEDPDTPKSTPRWFSGAHQQLHFHDVESAGEASRLNATAPSREQVEAILTFGEACLQQAKARNPVATLVHCFAGVSRSTAATFALICQALGPGEEAVALEFVRRIRPHAFPNALIVRWADELLGRNEKMIKALAPMRTSFTQDADDWIASVRRGD